MAEKTISENGLTTPIKKYLKKNLRGNEKPTNSYHWEFWYDHERNKESSEWYKEAKSKSRAYRGSAGRKNR